MILVVFAMREEAKDFAAWLKDQDLPVELAIIGVGAAAVRERLPKILEKGRPERLICAGFAGALTEELELGEVFLASNATSETGFRPQLKEAEIFSADYVVNDPADRLELAMITGAHAVDLESETVAAISAEWGISLLTLRAIIDAPNAPIPVPWSVSYDLVNQRVRPLATLRWFLVHPGKWVAFFRFLKRLRLARLSLTQVLTATLAESLR